MHSGQAEHKHDANRCNYCIHLYNLIERTTIKHRKAGNSGRKTAVSVAGSEGRTYLRAHTLQQHGRLVKVKPEGLHRMFAKES